MNRNPAEENRSMPSSKPPVYIPPVKRPGQIPPLQQPQGNLPPQQPAAQKLPQAGQIPTGPAQTAPPPSPQAAAPRSPGAGKPGPSTADAGQPAQAAVPYAPRYYRPIPRKQRPDYQYLAKRSFTAKGSAAVLFSLFFCMAFSEMVLWGNLGVSAPILTVAYSLFVFWYFQEPGRQIRPSAFLLSAPIAVISAGLCLSVTESTYFLTVPFLLCLLAVQTALLSGMPYGRLFSWETFGNLWVHLVDGPLSFLDFPFLVMRGHNKSEQRSKNFWKIFLGILCALPVAALLLWLFASADAVFRDGLQRLAQWLRIDWSHLFTDLLVGVFAGVFLSAALLYCRGALAEKPHPAGGKRFVDPLFAVPFLGLIDLSVLAFTLVQFTYLFGGEKGNLPGGYTYAEYARQGFFELAISVFFIFAIALFFLFFSRDDRPRRFGAIRVQLMLLSLGGGVILCSAVKRMLLYISVYGMSTKRGLTLWFMITTGICFLFLAAKCLLRRFPLAKCTGIAVIAMVCLLSLFPLDGFVARYNVNAYLAGHTETEVDCGYFQQLSVSALPAMVDLYLREPSDDLEWAIRQQIRANEQRHPIWGGTLDQIGIQESIRLFSQASGPQA